MLLFLKKYVIIKKRGDSMKTKDAVLQSLLASKGKYLSGEQISADLGISRSAVWKAVSQLRTEGCCILAATNHGYMLKSVPDRLDEVLLKNALKQGKFSRELHILQTVDSTNLLAKSLAAKGAPDGTVVISAKQTSGRGRLGKSFHSPEGGLYLSVVLRPELQMQDMMAVTACTAAAVCLALLDFGITSGIKWVNDLFLKGRKICGILSEGSFSMELKTLDYLVIGIGMNLHPDPGLPPDLREIVTDIESETGIFLSRTELAASILQHLEEELAGLSERKFMPVYEKYSCTIGHQVQVTVRGEKRICTAVGYTRNAELIVRLSDGSEEIVRTGSAVPVP